MNFVAATYEDWIREVSKYIKEKSPDEFRHHVGNGVYFQLFPQFKESLPPLEKSNGFSIGVDFPNPSQKQLITALENGASSISLAVNDDTNFEELFKDIRLDYIRPILRFSSKSAENKYHRYLTSNYSNPTSIFLASNAESTGHTLLESGNSDYIMSLSEVLQKAIDQKFERPAFQLSLSESFFKEIARIRALRVVISNLNHSIPTLCSDCIIIGKSNAQNLPNDDKEGLIHQAACALSGMIGGVNILMLQSWTNEKAAYARWAVHLQNMMLFESHINQHADPMAGSYFMEDLTQQIAQKVWDSLSL